MIASPTDGGVPYAHAQSLVRSIRRARLIESCAPSHLVWLGSDWPAIAEEIQRFLRTDPPTSEGLSLKS